MGKPRLKFGVIDSDGMYTMQLPAGSVLTMSSLSLELHQDLGYSMDKILVRAPGRWVSDLLEDIQQEMPESPPRMPWDPIKVFDIIAESTNSTHWWIQVTTLDPNSAERARVEHWWATKGHLKFITEVKPPAPPPEDDAA
jgi:hypothetical protein